MHTARQLHALILTTLLSESCDVSDIGEDLSELFIKLIQQEEDQSREKEDLERALKRVQELEPETDKLSKEIQKLTDLCVNYASSHERLLALVNESLEKNRPTKKDLNGIRDQIVKTIYLTKKSS